MESFKSMYPRGIRVIQSYVSEACDRMDYQNSPMYDEWPEQRMVDRMCDSVCQTVSASGDMGILKDVWEMQEKKTVEKMDVEENIEGTELKTEAEKLQAAEQESDGEIETTEENQMRMETEKEDIHQVTAEVDLEEDNGMVESQEMRPPLRRWWNGWGINGIGPNVQGMAWGTGPMYAPVGSAGFGNDPGVQSQEMRCTPRPGTYPVWFRDIVKTLILDEMQDRRRRRGMWIN